MANARWKLCQRQEPTGERLYKALCRSGWGNQELANSATSTALCDCPAVLQRTVTGQSRRLSCRHRRLREV